MRHTRPPLPREPSSFGVLALCFGLGVALPTLLAGPLAPSAEAAPATPTADELLAAIDRNMVFDTRSSKMTMTVTKNGRTKGYGIQSYGRGTDEAAIEFLDPPRDKGTKMLKKGGELWMYLPSIEKTQKISGHMLRQGLMGSDFSYEDMMETATMRLQYTATVLGAEVSEGRPCWKLEMKAKEKNVAYSRRLTWVDQETLIPIRQELYALSGMLLKTWTMSDIQTYGTRRFPSHMVIESSLEKGASTDVRFTEMVFSVALEEEVFSLRWLER